MCKIIDGGQLNEKVAKYFSLLSLHLSVTRKCPLRGHFLVKAPPALPQDYTGGQPAGSGGDFFITEARVI